MKDRVLMIGVGQAGGNIAKQSEERGFLSYYINSNKGDLDIVGAGRDNRYKVPLASGFNGDRNKAVQYARKYALNMAERIEEAYDTQKYIFVSFGAGGSTGSVFGPILIEMLAVRNPDKYIAGVIALPGMDEDLSFQDNARKTYKYLLGRKGMRNLFILDNNHNPDIHKINEIFANNLDKLFTAPSYTNAKGNIDTSEVDKCLSIRGMSMLLDLPDPDNDDLKKAFTQNTHNIHTEYSKGCQYTILSSNKEYKKNELDQYIGHSLRNYRGYNNNDFNLLGIFGMRFPEDRIKRYNESIENQKNKLFNGDVEINLDFEDSINIATDPITNGDSRNKKDNDIDFDQLFDDFN